MDIDEKRQVTQRMEDGSYYIDAIDWYASRYLFPVTERSLMLIIAIVSVSAFIMSILNITKLSTDIDKPPIVNFVDYESPHSFSFIRPLVKDSESPQEAVAKYLIKDYVVSREQYIAKEMLRQTHMNKLTKKIKGTSSKDILEQFQFYMSKSNPYSPFLRYQDHTDRLITINSIEFLTNKKELGKANVYFTATKKTRGKKNVMENQWVATLHFRLPSVEIISKTGAPLRFSIEYYKVSSR